MRSYLPILILWSSIFLVKASEDGVFFQEDFESLDGWTLESSPSSKKPYMPFDLVSSSASASPGSETLRYKMSKPSSPSSSISSTSSPLILQMKVQFGSIQKGSVNFGLFFKDSTRSSLLYFGLVAGLPVFGVQNGSSTDFFDIFDEITAKSIYDAKPPSGVSSQDGNYLDGGEDWVDFSLELSPSPSNDYKIMKNDKVLREGSWNWAEEDSWMMDNPGATLVKAELYARTEPNAGPIRIDSLLAKK